MRATINTEDRYILRVTLLKRQDTTSNIDRLWDIIKKCGGDTDGQLEFHSTHDRELIYKFTSKVNRDYAKIVIRKLLHSI